MSAQPLGSHAGPYVTGSDVDFHAGTVPDGFFCAIVGRGQGRSTGELLAKLASTLKFPKHFGGSYNALSDCINDLNWLPAPGYVVVIRNGGELYEDESAEALTALLDLFDRAGREWATPIASGEWWDRGPVPFHTIVEVPPDGVGTHTRVLRRHIASLRQ